MLLFFHQIHILHYHENTLEPSSLFFLFFSLSFVVVKIWIIHIYFWKWICYTEVFAENLVGWNYSSQFSWHLQYCSFKAPYRMVKQASIWTGIQWAQGGLARLKCIKNSNEFNLSDLKALIKTRKVGLGRKGCETNLTLIWGPGLKEAALCFGF